MIQLLPNTSDEVIQKLETKLANVKSITSMLDAGMTPEDILEDILGDFGYEITEKLPTDFCCNCNKERVSKALISIGKKELCNIISDGKPIDVNCHFCNQCYHFTLEELEEFLRQA